ncbi:MAG: hypothetical protein ACSHWY_10660 [Octadecabacter sp.]
MPTLSRSSSRRGSGSVFTIPNAANLAADSYAIRTNATLARRVKAKIDEADVQAYMLDDDVLLIPGSNSALDYLRYNVRLLNIGGKRYRVKNGATGEVLGRVWHQGFLAHAMLIHEKFKAAPPKFIIGHSLGAASAQVLSMIWDVPAIGFAAPRLYAGGLPVNNAHKCLCLWRTDDPVGSLPGSRFRHAGTSIALGKSRRMGFLNHHMKHYKSAITDPNHKSVVPAVWPAS